jgi:hypothetical protein
MNPVPHTTDVTFTRSFNELADHNLKTAMALFVHLAILV